MIGYGLFSLAMWAFYQYLIARMLGVRTWTWVANYIRFAPVWGALMAFWFVWPRGEGGLAPELAWLLGGGAAGCAVYAILLAVFHRAHLAELWRLRHALGAAPAAG